MTGRWEDESERQGRNRPQGWRRASERGLEGRRRRESQKQQPGQPGRRFRRATELPTPCASARHRPRGGGRGARSARRPRRRERRPGACPTAQGQRGYGSRAPGAPPRRGCVGVSRPACAASGQKGCRARARCGRPGKKGARRLVRHKPAPKGRELVAETMHRDMHCGPTRAARGCRRRRDGETKLARRGGPEPSRKRAVMGPKGERSLSAGSAERDAVLGPQPETERPRAGGARRLRGR